MADHVTGTGGDIRSWFELWRATIDNVMVEDISRYLNGGSMSMNRDRAVTTQATFPLRDAAVVNPYIDYLAVFQNIEYEDGRPARREQLGLFGIRIPSGTRTTRRADGTYTGTDISARLQRFAFSDVYNIADGTNYVTAIVAILALAGITRYDIDPTTEVLATPRTFPPGTLYIDAVNTLLEAIGYFNLAATPDGKAMSRPSLDVKYIEPFATITDAALMGPVDSQPTDNSVSNVVIVVQENPNAVSLWAVRRNDDASSPTSSVSLDGDLVRVETRSNLENQAAVDALADRLLSEGRSFYQPASIRLLPDPRVVVPGQTIDLNLTGKLAIYNGRWRVRTATIGFSPEGAGPRLEINRVTDAITGAII